MPDANNLSNPAQAKDAKNPYLSSDIQAAATDTGSRVVPKPTTRALDAEGTVGKQFQPDGAIGSVGEAVGGPLASDGVIGKHFTKDGAIGGTINDKLGGEAKKW